MDDETIATITRRVLQRMVEPAGSASGFDRSSSSPSPSPSPSPSEGGMLFTAGVSARHVHLGREHLAVLFGPGYELTVRKALRQPEQFAAEETVAVVGPKRAIYGVRILGPARSATQVEIAMTDALSLGIEPVVRHSGDHRDTPGCVLLGPKGSVALDRGVIVAARHLHVDPPRAAALGLKDKDLVSVRVAGGVRSLMFAGVLVRCGDAHLAEFHVDTDEANAASVSSGALVEVVKS